MMKNLWLPLFLLATCSIGGAAFAQTAAVSPSQEGPCQPGQQPSSPEGSGPKGCASNGVIQPPAVGDSGVVKPPDTGSAMPMPVIPPPGTPGGNPSVQPK